MEQNEPVDAWLKRSNPNLVTRIRVVSCNDYLQCLVHTFLADAGGSKDYSIPSLHGRLTALRLYSISKEFISFSMSLPQPRIYQNQFFLDAKLRAKSEFIGFFAWWPMEASIYGHESTYLTEDTYESNISAFARLFQEVSSHSPLLFSLCVNH
jgi:hypothetical protein